MLDWRPFFAAEEEAYRLLLHEAAVGRNWRTVAWIKHVMERATGTILDAHIAKVWGLLGNDEQRLLWRAPTKGGCFTVEERKRLRDILPNSNPE